MLLVDTVSTCVPTALLSNVAVPVEELRPPGRGRAVRAVAD